MVHQLLAIIRYRLITRLPDVGLLYEARTQEYRDARNYLVDVAKGLVSIEQPVSADTTPRKQMPPSIAGRAKQFSRAQQDGI
jgi:phage gp36-like protein